MGCLRWLGIETTFPLNHSMNLLYFFLVSLCGWREENKDKKNSDWYGISLCHQMSKYMHGECFWRGRLHVLNFRRRNILPSTANVECIFCKKEEESVRHVFFECEYSYKLWMECLSWLGIQTALPSNQRVNLCGWREKDKELGYI